MAKKKRPPDPAPVADRGACRVVYGIRSDPGMVYWDFQVGRMVAGRLWRWADFEAVAVLAIPAGQDHPVALERIDLEAVARDGRSQDGATVVWRAQGSESQ